MGRGDTNAPSHAERYASYWEPVLAPAGRRLVDALEREHLLSDQALAPSGDLRLLDVGTGTGQLAIDALQRWPGARVIGVDPSGAMLSVAQRRAAGIATAAGRLDLYEAQADRLPLSDRAVDLVVSSFVFQLVPDRLAALRETYRVLRPGGLLGYVTWIETADLFSPRAIVDDELGAQAGTGANDLGSGAQTYTVEINGDAPGMSVSPTTLSLAAGQSDSFTVSLSLHGAATAAYEGDIVVTDATGRAYLLPFWYAVGQ